jgi:hypothetical protein
MIAFGHHGGDKFRWSSQARSAPAGKRSPSMRLGSGPGKCRFITNAQDPVCDKSVDPGNCRYWRQSARQTNFALQARCRAPAAGGPLRPLRRHQLHTARRARGGRRPPLIPGVCSTASQTPTSPHSTVWEFDLDCRDCRAARLPPVGPYVHRATTDGTRRAGCAEGGKQTTERQERGAGLVCATVAQTALPPTTNAASLAASGAIRT